MTGKSVFRIARRAWLFAWLFFAFYLATIMATAYGLGMEPRLFGLPFWVAVSCVLVPLVFVLLLIILVERFIPDIPLEDNREEPL